MNINVYLEEQLASEITLLAKELDRSRNAIIREALSAYIAKHKTKQWPTTVLRYKGDSDAIAFESYRDELKPIKDDPLK